MDAQTWKQRNQLLSLLFLSLGFLIQLSLEENQVNAQDILRRNHAQPQHQLHQAQANNNGRGQSLLNSENPLANIQLPPQLASLTPAQLHQLAQLRELQLQQQAAAAQQDQQSAPAPIGAETLTPTAQPASVQSNGAQIPMPQSQSSAESSRARANAASELNDKHDDGAYNESGSEMEGVIQPSSGGEANSSGGGASQTAAQTGVSSPEASSAPAQASAPTFEVNWNKCPQLEPSESEKSKKTQVITKCLQSSPIPSSLTRENVENHREQIATCALRVEGWFDEQGDYRYDKAESEIRGKKLDKAIENQVLKFHIACKEESNKKFPRNQNKLIDQVQFYQACMDYYISIVCEIEVSVDQ